MASADLIKEAPLFNFSKTKLAKDYAGFYVKILDNVFTPEECQWLISLAESDAKWEEAAVHYGLGKDDKYVDKSYRNSERILRFDKEAADMMYSKLRPYIPEVWEVKEGSPWEEVVQGKGWVTDTWKLIGINERLSFLRYGPGNYFRTHCDGRLDLPDGRKGRVTLQVYLNEEGLEGGATRIWDRKGENYIDVQPKAGRVLVFQQKGLWHSGEDVTKGLKYTVRSDFMYMVEPVESVETVDQKASEEAKKSGLQGLLGGTGLSSLKGKLGW